MRAVAILVLVVPVVVQADRPLSRNAAAHDQRGRELYREKDYDGASHEFEAAYDIEQAPQVLYHWAQAERFAGRCERAIQLYHRYIDDGARASASADDVRSLIKDCESTLLDPPREPAPREPVREQPARPPWFRDRLAVGLAGGGVVALGVGIGHLAAASSERGAADRAFYLDDHVHKLAIANAERAAGGISIGIAAALVGSGVFVAVQHRRRRDTVLTFAGTGVVLAGSW